MKRIRCLRIAYFFHRFALVACLVALLMIPSRGVAQVNVLTAHNDIARTGQNLSETVLTASNVTPAQFGKLFSQPVNSTVWAQPLYVSQIAIPGKGTHNVVYVATAGDTIYAFDADTNGGINANPLWKASLLTNSTPAGTLTNGFGIVGTPVIDLASNTMYVVSSESKGSIPINRLHGLDITTGVEKLGGPVQIQASIPGTGVGSTAGVLNFDPTVQEQRPGLLLLNGVVYAAFGSQADVGSWHGWIFSFSAATLQQLDVFCTSPNGSGSGVWLSGAGLAAEVNNPAKPYGRMFVATGNGTYAASAPYTAAMSYGMSVLDLDLTGGQMTVEDEFTPYNEAVLDAQDGDLGAGGAVLLPSQTLANGKTLNPLVQIGKSGMIYILDRDNNTDGSNNPATEYSPAGLGGFSSTADQVVQEVQTPITKGLNWGAGVWGTEAYWNDNIYSGGTNPGKGQFNGTGNSLTAYSFVKGVLSTTPTSQSTEQYVFAGPTPAISANGTTNGIVWAINNNAFASDGPSVLLAYDATNLAHTIYSSSTNPSRDTPSGTALRFTVPTIANGKVYVGTNLGFSVYGLLNATPVAPAPVITPASKTFTGTQTVTITDAIAGATIYYTTNGSEPTVNSTVYSSTNPPVVSSTETITATASPNGYVQSAPSSETYTLATAAATPVFSLAPGTYTGAQTLTIADSSPNPTIYYTLDGSTPTASSPVYSNPVVVPVSTSVTIQALAVSPGLTPSSVVSATYSILPAYEIYFPQGFAGAEGPMHFNGSTTLDDFRLQLTHGEMNEAGSAFYATPVNVQAFTTDFTFQLSNPAGDGITFTIQNAGPAALGSFGAALGYATIPQSVAIKFDIFNDGGEGPNSTGLFINGAMPTVPAINLTGTGIDLHSGDMMNAHITYDGTNLTMTLTDALTLASWSTSWAINIPSAVGGATAWVGFTGSTGTSSASQKLTYWAYLEGQPVVPNYPVGFDGLGMTLNGGAAWSGSRLRVTDGGINETRSAFFTLPVNIQQFSTNFDFQLTNPTAEGITFTIQKATPAALGAAAANLGYGSLSNSVAVKFDLYNDAGEGMNSTGMYIDGAPPTNPATDLSFSGINLHSGDIFNAQLGYDGVTLTVIITDTVTGASATQSYAVNILSAVGGPAAYVGFTGSTSGSTATQDILNWSYSTTYVAPRVPTVAPPLIGSLSSSYGAPFATVILTGSNFGATQAANTVTFNGVPATVTAWSNTAITVSVPYHATTGGLVVTVAGHSSNGLPFKVEPYPSISAINPTSGPPGTLVTITGQNLLDAHGQGEVFFSGIYLHIVNSSNTSLQVAIPSGAVTGTFDVHINGVGNYTSIFTVTAVPQIVSVSANYGAPYAMITLTGTNFAASQNASTVTFDGVPAAVTAWSNTAIAVSVPYHAATGNLVVTVSGQSSNGIFFTVEPTPSITGISPISGAPGTLVTISGQNLLDAEGHTQVWFSGRSLSITNQSSSSLQVVIPSGAATGTFDVHTNGVGNFTPIFAVN